MECNYFVKREIFWSCVEKMHVALNIQVNVSRIGIPGRSSLSKENLSEVLFPRYVVQKI